MVQTRKQRARKLGDVIQDTEWRAASTPYNADAIFDTQVKAKEGLTRLGYKWVWTGPYTVRVVPVRPSSRSRGHVRRLGFLESAEGRPMSVYHTEG